SSKRGSGTVSRRRSGRDRPSADIRRLRRRAVRSARHLSDISQMKLREHGWRGVGRSMLVFAPGPAAIIAIPWLQRAHLIAQTPLPLLVVLLLACSASNACAIALEARLSPTRGLHLPAATAATPTAWVVYATGWGPILVIGFAVGIADALRIHGSRPVRPGRGWSAVAIVGGEITVPIGPAPTGLRHATAHAAAASASAC